MNTHLWECRFYRCAKPISRTFLLSKYLMYGIIIPTGGDDMLVMPILINSNQQSKICNVEIKLKSAVKVKKKTDLKGFGQSDIIVNGSSFNNSVYNIVNKRPNVVVNFVRNNNMRSDKKNFLISTRSYSNSPLFDLYNVESLPRKVSSGLDNLLGTVLLDIQKEIPDIKHGRNVDLKELGVDFHITDDKIEKLKYIVENVEDKDKWEYLFSANGIGDLKSTIDFMNLFDFTIINESTISKENLTSVINSFSYLYDQNYRTLNKYYNKAINNREVFHKLNILNQLIYEKPIHLIHKKEDEKILVMKKNGNKGEKDAA